jgi:hypothetical protein
VGMIGYEFFKYFVFPVLFFVYTKEPKKKFNHKGTPRRTKEAKREMTKK